MIIVDGKKIREEILREIKKEVALLPFRPIFCDILVGEDPVSRQYVQMKKNTAEAVGMIFHEANFPASINTEELVQEIEKINKIPKMCGVIVQLPLPQHLDRQKILDAIDPKLDVDCLGSVASEKFYKNEGELGFPTALACLALLDSLGLDNNPSTTLRTRKILVLGQGMLVGRPVTALLHSRGFRPTLITRETPEEEKKNLMKEADVIISGIGQGKYIKGEMIKKGAVLIDAGTSESDGGIVGDVDLESVRDAAGYVSPVPGGVGPVTVAMLLQNVLKVAKNLQ